MRIGPDHSFARLGALALVLVTAACTARVATPPRQVDLPFPSPLAGPGQPELDRQDWRKVDQGWRQLAAGELRAARASVAGIPGVPQAQLLALQIDLVDGTGDPTGALAALTRQQPEMAAAWVTLSVAAERAGDETGAYGSAQRAAAAWPRSPWRDRPAELYRRWVDDRIADARGLLAEGRAEDALGALTTALALDPERRDAGLLEAQALAATGRVAEAEDLLGSFGTDPDALVARARLAENRGDWEDAMDLYRSLPEERPERAPGLANAQLRWRLSIMPRYVHEALASDSLTRAQLAVILVATAPGLETVDVGPVPLLSDIVDLPSQREIVTVVRAQLLQVDPLERRFFPNLIATPEVIRDAVEALCHLLGYRSPLWCSPQDDPQAQHCDVLPNPVSGRALAELMLTLAEEPQP